MDRGFSLLIILILYLGAVGNFLEAVTLPVVDKGVFVITGVKTCGSSLGYCILGNDCTIDKEFVQDDKGGHCDGLRKAFTPRASFVCCKLAGVDNVTTPPSTTTSIPSIASIEVDSNSVEEEEPDSGSEEVKDKDKGSSESVEDSMTTLIPPSSSSSSGGSTPTTPPTTLNPILETSTTSIVTEDLLLVDVRQKQPSFPAIVTDSPLNNPGSMETITETITEVRNLTIVSSCSSSGSGHRRKRIEGEKYPTTCWTGALTRTPNLNHTHIYHDPGTFLCSGALITPTLLLTTATCVSRLFGQDLGGFRVVLGAGKSGLLHPSLGESDAEYREVEELVIHEDYGVVGGGVYRVNDVAIVRLSPPPTNSSSHHHICTVCLPDTSRSSVGYSKDCIVSGFSHPTVVGTEHPHTSTSTLHDALQTLEPSEICERAISNYTRNVYSYKNEFVNKGLLCASGRVGQEACFSPRDAGSPLACPSKDGSEYRLAGLFSSGFHCGTKSMPVLYTDITEFVDWVGKFL